MVNTTTASSSCDIKVDPKRDEMSCHASQNAEQPSLQRVALLRKAYLPSPFEGVMTPSRRVVSVSFISPAFRWRATSIPPRNAEPEAQNKHPFPVNIIFSQAGQLPRRHSFSADVLQSNCNPGTACLFNEMGTYFLQRRIVDRLTKSQGIMCSK